jgi:uncharacterized protein YndB with AHSA1/START domain
MPATANEKSNAAAEGYDLTLTRTFDAPRELVFQAWTDPRQVAQWWGPHHFTNPRCEVDARKGGAIVIDMRGPDGTIYPSHGVFEEAAAPERIVIKMSVPGPDGNILFEVRNTATFEERAGKTTLTLTAVVLSKQPGAEMYLNGMREGWTQSLERLGAFVSKSEDTSDREIVATRSFDAPRELVWKLWTEPEHIAKWWGPAGFTNTIRKMDVRPGGTWEFVMHGPDGTDYQNKIVYREVVKPERLSYTHLSGPVFDATATFAEHRGQTSVTVRMVFETAELRDRTVRQFGAVEGLHQTLGRLGEELKKMSGSEEFVMSRVFNAPVDVVYRAWAEPEQLQKWFGPKGVSLFHSKGDVRPGGIYLYGMRTSDGGEMWGKWVYREIVPNERLVFVNSFSDKDGGTTRHPMAPTWPLEMLSTIEFADEGGKTRVTVHWSPLNATDVERKTFSDGMASMTGGWSGTMDKLDAYLPGL